MANWWGDWKIVPGSEFCVVDYSRPDGRGRKAAPDDPYAEMSRDELLAVCREIYEREGIVGLSYPRLSTYGSLYNRLYGCKLP